MFILLQNLTIMKHDLNVLMNKKPYLTPEENRFCKESKPPVCHVDMNKTVRNISDHIDAEAQEILKEVARILQTSQPAIPNLTQVEFQPLKTLRNHEIVTILKTDIGNSTEVMNTKNYTQKMRGDCYKPAK